MQVDVSCASGHGAGERGGQGRAERTCSMPPPQWVEKVRGPRDICREGCPAAPAAALSVVPPYLVSQGHNRKVRLAEWTCSGRQGPGKGHVWLTPAPAGRERWGPRETSCAVRPTATSMLLMLENGGSVTKHRKRAAG